MVPSSTAQLSRNVEILADGAVDAPTRLKLFAAGKVDTTKGVFNFDDKSAVSVLDNARDYGNKFCFDYGHAMLGFSKSDPAEAGKAAGWFTPALGADGALYADAIEWTPKAKAMILAREYRYVSPAFCHDDEGNILEIVNAALTNIPATKRMDPIMAHRSGTEEKQSMEPKILAQLGLIATAGAADVTAKIAELQAVAGRVADLEKQIAGYREASQKAELASLVRQGTDDGKITPAMLAWANAQAPEVLKAYLAVAPAAVKAPAKEIAPATEFKASELELQILKGLGVSEDAAKKERPALLTKGFIKS